MGSLGVLHQWVCCRNIKELYSVGDLQAAIGDSKGNPLLLTIYSPSCRPCRDFLGRLDSLWDVFGQSVNLAKFSMRHQGELYSPNLLP